MADSADVLHPGDRELSSFNWDLCGPRVRQAMVSHGGRTAFTIKQVYGMPLKKKEKKSLWYVQLSSSESACFQPGGGGGGGGGKSKETVGNSWTVLKVILGHKYHHNH